MLLIGSLGSPFTSRNGLNKEDIRKISKSESPDLGYKGHQCFTGARNVKFEIKMFQLYFQSRKHKKGCLPIIPFPFPQPPPAPLHSEKEFVILPALPLNDLDTST